MTCCPYVRPTNNPRHKRRWSGKYMPTVSTVTVKSSGGDYTSLAGAEAGEQADLVSADVQLDIECYAFEDTTRCDFDGWTTDATRYIRVFTPTAERHNGAWDTSAYRLVVAANSGLATFEDYIRIEGLQLSASVTAPFFVGNGLGTSDVRVDSCLITGGQVGVRLGSGTINIRNTIIFDCGGDGVLASFSGPTVNLDNCTIAGCGAYGINNVLGTVAARNCYADGVTDAYSGTITKTTCAHSSATVFAGSTASIPHSTDTFVNVTGGSEDYHLAAGSDLIDAGTDLSGTFTTDIDGETRSGDWDIGADEFPAATGSPWYYYASQAAASLLAGAFA